MKKKKLIEHDQTFNQLQKKLNDYGTIFISISRNYRKLIQVQALDPSEKNRLQGTALALYKTLYNLYKKLLSYIDPVFLSTIKKKDVESASNLVDSIHKITFIAIEELAAINLLPDKKGKMREIIERYKEIKDRFREIDFKVSMAIKSPG